MKNIKVKQIAEERISFDDWLGKHELVVEVTERPAEYYDLPRWYASVPRLEARDGCACVGEFGNGDTTWEAISDYADKLRGKRLVLGAMGPERREFVAPREWNGLE
jgi:hypothetical protein